MGNNRSPELNGIRCAGVAIIPKTHHSHDGTEVASPDVVETRSADPPADQQNRASHLIAVCGAHMSGLPLNPQLLELGATLVEMTRTTDEYRLFVLEDIAPPRPGMLRVGDKKGAAIDIEVWAVPNDQVGRMLQRVPPPLCIGSISLANGGTVHGFLCEAYSIQRARDITEFGGWRHFLRHECAHNQKPATDTGITDGE